MPASHSNYDELAPHEVPRAVAVVLALGGSFWGLLLSPWLFRPDVPPAANVIVGPGYLVTVGYIARSVITRRGNVPGDRRDKDSLRRDDDTE